MSMVTVYVSIKDGVALAIAESTDVSEAVRQLSWFPGEVYACRVSEDAAKEIRDAIVSEGTRKTKQPALSMLKMYSQSMQKCADVT